MANKSIFELLKAKYREGEYALMEEVSDAAGMNRSRSADYIVMSLWPSRGLYISGIELKSYRSDWLSELKNPKKAENIFQYCDYFWLLTSDDTIAKIEEIPATWGWMCVSGNKIVVKKDAPKNEPKQVSRNFLASMLKRASSKDNYVHSSSISDKIKDAEERGKESAKRTIQQLEDKLAEYKRIVDDFNANSGVRLDRWKPVAKIAEAVDFISNGGADEIQKRLLSLEQVAKSVLSDIEKGVASMKEATVDSQPSQ